MSRTPRKFNFSWLTLRKRKKNSAISSTEVSSEETIVKESSQDMEEKSPEKKKTEVTQTDNVSDKIKEVHKDEISIHVSRKGEKPVENTELLTISTDLAIRRKSDEAINTSTGVDIVDSPAYIRG